MSSSSSSSSSSGSTLERCEPSLTHVGVADDEMVHRGVWRKKIAGALPADAVGDFGAIDFFFPRVGQRLVHVAGNDERVCGLPGLRFVFQ